MPNPLTDELSPEAKAELAAVFADMKRRYQEPRISLIPAARIRKQPLVRRGW